MIVEQRADGKVETEATIKIWVDGERYVRTAEGNGPVHALDAALRAAIGEIHPHLKDIELVNYKVRILDEHHGTGATTRVLIDASDGHDIWGSIGVNENIIAASWEALVDSLAYAEQPGAQRRTAGRGDAHRRGVTPATDVIPLARPVLGPEEEAAVIEVLRSGQLSLGPRVPAFEQAFAASAGRGARERGLQRHRGAAPGAAGGRRDRGRRGRHVAVLVRGQRQRDAVRARAPGVRRHRRRSR